MKTKILISILVLMIIGLLVVLVSTFFTYRQIRPVVRQADRPGQSTLRYDPPPPPKISVEALKGVANILKMSERKIEKVTEKGIVLERQQRVCHFLPLGYLDVNHRGDGMLCHLHNGCA